MASKEEVTDLNEFALKAFQANAAPSDKFEKIVSVLKAYSEPEQLLQKTELSPREIIFIARLLTYKEAIDKEANVKIPYIDIFLDAYLQAKISKDRKGRNEFIAVLKAIAERAKEEESNEGILDKLFSVKE